MNRSDSGRSTPATPGLDEAAPQSAERRARFLVETSMALASYLDGEEALRALAGLLVSYGMDYCVTYLLEDDGSVRRAGLAHARDDGAALLREIDARYAPRLDDETGVGPVLRAGRAELTTRVTDEQLARHAADAEHLRLLRALETASMVAVPLQARGRILGAIVAASTAGGRAPLQPADLALVRELADRAALAVDNARLHQRLERELRERVRVEETLRESEERFRATFEQAAVGIAQLAPDFRWLRVNDRLCEILGYSRDELFRLRFPDITHPDDVAADMAQAERLRRGEIDRYTMEKRYVRRDGSPVWTQLTGSVVREPDGEPRFYIAVLEDISRRKRLEAERDELLARERRARAEVEARERQFRTLADSIPQLAWMADEHGSIFWYNQRWYDYTGTTPEQVRGWGWRRVHHPEEEERVVAGFSRALRTGEPWEDTFPLRGKNGDYRWFLSRAVPVRDDAGRVVRWFGTNTDVEEQWQAEQERDRALAEAEHANRAKSELLATMSHELRTPLNAIGGYVDLIELEIHGPVTEAQRRSLERVRRNQQHLLSLINDILNFARLEAGRVELHIEELAVDPLLLELEALMEPRVEGAALRYEYERCDPGLRVVGDPERIHQILLNLISNSIKFTPAHGAIRLTCDADAERVHVRVHDTGRGIPADRLESVFDPFVQVDRRAQGEAQGVGLGLAISRDLARAMGGELTARSELAVGSTFTLSLPAAPPSAAG